MPKTRKRARRQSIWVLEARTPSRGLFKWSPIPAYSSLNGADSVMVYSAGMRALCPKSQFRVVTYVPER